MTRSYTIPRWWYTKANVSGEEFNIPSRTWLIAWLLEKKDKRTQILTYYSLYSYLDDATHLLCRTIDPDYIDQSRINYARPFGAIERDWLPKSRS